MQNANTTSYGTTPLVFEYWDEAPHAWSSYLEKEVKPSGNQVILPILWGIHETNRGVYDFSKQSRLRVERVLSLCQSLSIDVVVVIGFPAHSQSYPDWAWQNSQKEIIPRRIWDENSPHYSSLAVPSPNDPEIKEAFKLFVQEAGTLLGLYRAPEGPVKRIHLSLVPLEFSQSLTQHTKHTSNIEARYRLIEEFNSRFQTNYRNFNALGTIPGCRYIEEKRPWLFAYDYQWSRHQIMSDFVKELLEIEGLGPIRDLIQLDNYPDHDFAGCSKESNFVITFDSVTLQTTNQTGISSASSIHPFWVEGILNSKAMQSFQGISWMRERAIESGISFNPLPTFQSVKEKNGALLSFPNQIVIGGKYLTQSAYQSLETLLKAGGGILFPFGLPQYDENQTTIDWVRGAPRESVRLDRAELSLFRPKGGGRIFSFINQSFNPLTELNTGNWQQFLNIAKGIFEGAANG